VIEGILTTGELAGTALWRRTARLSALVLAVGTVDLIVAHPTLADALAIARTPELIVRTVAGL